MGKHGPEHIRDVKEHLIFFFFLFPSWLVTAQSMS